MLGLCYVQHLQEFRQLTWNKQKQLCKIGIFKQKRFSLTNIIALTVDFQNTMKDKLKSKYKILLLEIQSYLEKLLQNTRIRTIHNADAR